MKNLKCILTLAFLLTLSACGSDSSSGGGGGGGNGSQKVSWVDWDSVPSQFNPEIEEYSFQMGAIDKLSVNLFSFDNDVELLYSAEAAPDTVTLKVYTVMKGSASWGRHEASIHGNQLNIKSYGTYSCSIRVRNRQIEALEGGCYVRLQIVMPLNSQIEVYNTGTLISRRFIPMDTETFLERFDDASSFNDEKFAVIEEFIRSYEGTSKTPSLTSKQLGIVIDDLTYKEPQLRALRRLHPFVSDRQNLRDMIEEEFSYFDREEALRIIGPN